MNVKNLLTSFQGLTLTGYIITVSLHIKNRK
jgi:hypothetical protein